MLFTHTELKVFAFSLALFFPSGAFAQTSILLEEVIVTAQKRTQDVQDVPMSIAAFGAETLRTAGISKSRDIAKVTPNLQWKGDSDVLGNTIHLRGVGTPSFGPESVSAVGIYVDEIAYSNTNLAGFFLYDLDRVEVLRGPQGTLYGRNTTGGAINYHSKKPVVGEGVNGYLSAGYSSFNQVNIEGSGSFPLGDKATARISATSKVNNGNQNNRFLGTRANALDAQAIRGQIIFEPVKAISVLASVYHGRFEGVGGLFKQLGLIDQTTLGPCANPYLGNPNCGDLFGFQDNDDLTSFASEFEPRDIARVNGGTINFSWVWGGYRLDGITGYVEYFDDGEQDIDASAADILRTGVTAPSDQFSQEVRLTSYDNPNLNWVAGGYYFSGDVSQSTVLAFRGLGQSGISGNSGALEAANLIYDEHTETFSVFAEGTFKVTDALSFTAGLRQTWEDKKSKNDSYLIDVDSLPGSVPPRGDYSEQIIFPFFENIEDTQNISEVSWRLAADYKISDNVLSYASLSRGFKSGVGNSQATFDTVETGFTDPEFITAYEFGIKSYWFDRNLRLNASVFYYDFTDQQVSIFENTALIQSNVGESKIIGLEVELASSFNHNWSGNFGVGLLDAQYTVFNGGAGNDYSGNRLVSAPKVNINGLLRYDHSLGNGNFSAQADVTYTGEQFFSPNNDPLLVQDGYWLMGGRAAYLFSDDNTEIALWVKNLGNNKYLVDAYDVADFGYDLLFPGSERSYGVELTFKF